MAYGDDRADDVPIDDNAQSQGALAMTAVTGHAVCEEVTGRRLPAMVSPGEDRSCSSRRPDPDNLIANQKRVDAHGQRRCRSINHGDSELIAFDADMGNFPWPVPFQYLAPHASSILSHSHDDREPYRGSPNRRKVPTAAFPGRPCVSCPLR